MQQLPLQLFKAAAVLLKLDSLTHTTPTPLTPPQHPCTLQPAQSELTTHLRAPAAYQASLHGAVTRSYSGSSFQLSGGCVLFSQTFMRTMTKPTQTRAGYINFKAGLLFLHTLLHSAAAAVCGSCPAKSVHFAHLLQLRR